jgi:hypothetical protein
MAFSGMLHRVTIARTDDLSEEHIAFIIRVTGIDELGTTVLIQLVFLLNVLRLLVTANVVPSSPILFILMMEAIHPSET